MFVTNHKLTETQNLLIISPLILIKKHKMKYFAPPLI